MYWLLSHIISSSTTKNNKSHGLMSEGKYYKTFVKTQLAIVGTQTIFLVNWFT